MGDDTVGKDSSALVWIVGVLVCVGRNCEIRLAGMTAGDGSRGQATRSAKSSSSS